MTHVNYPIVVIAQKFTFYLNWAKPQEAMSEQTKSLELALERWGDNLDRECSDSPVMEAV